MNAASAQMFTRHNKTLIADISEVQGSVSVVNQGLHNERMAISVQNPKTKNTVTWRSVRAVTNSEGEIERWIFEPLAWDVIKFPALADWQMVLYND